METRDRLNKSLLLPMGDEEGDDQLPTRSFVSYCVPNRAQTCRRIWIQRRRGRSQSET